MGITIIALVGRVQPRQVYFSYLTAFVYFLSIALGGLFFVGSGRPAGCGEGLTGTSP